MFAPMSAGYVRRSKQEAPSGGSLGCPSILGKGCPMANAPGSTETTVTLFGGSDPLDHALGTQLEQRGCRTHFVSVPTGWLRSATHAVMRLDTAAGAEAIQELSEIEQPYSHVIAICPETVDSSESDRLREMCRACGMHHDVSLIWHPPLDAAVPSTTGVTSRRDATRALAATVADELVEHATAGRPSFAARPFLLEDPH